MIIMAEFDLNFYKNTLKYSSLPDISEEVSPQSDDALLWVSYKVAEEVVSNGSTKNIDAIQQKWLDNMRKQLKKEIQDLGKQFETGFTVPGIEDYVKPPIQAEVIVEDTPTLPPKKIVDEPPAWKPPLESLGNIVDNTKGIVYVDAPQQTSSFVEQEKEKQPERRVMFGGKLSEEQLVAELDAVRRGEYASEYPDIYDIDPNSNPNMIYFILIILIFIFVIKKS